MLETRSHPGMRCCGTGTLWKIHRAVGTPERFTTSRAEGPLSLTVIVCVLCVCVCHLHQRHPASMSTCPHFRRPVFLHKRRPFLPTVHEERRQCSLSCSFSWSCVRCFPVLLRERQKRSVPSPSCHGFTCCYSAARDGSKTLRAVGTERRMRAHHPDRGVGSLCAGGTVHCANPPFPTSVHCEGKEGARQGVLLRPCHRRVLGLLFRQRPGRHRHLRL